MAEVRNAMSQALADGRYLKLDCTNGPLTGNLEMKHIGSGRAPTDTHNIIVEELYTTPSNPGSIIGAGIFNRYAPAVLGNNSIVAVQGNAWFDTNRWGVGSTVRCLDFFPAPSVTGIAWGSANLKLYGINTAGLLNVANRPVIADEITAISLVPIASIFGGDDTTCNVARGLRIASAVATTGVWGRLTGLQLDPQTSGAINQGMWLKGDGIGSDLNFGAGSGNNPDARILFDGSALVIKPNLIGANDYILLDGDVRISAGKTLDLATLGAYFKPRRLNQAGIPTPTLGCLLMWRNSTTGVISLVYNDPTSGVKSVELT